MANFLSDFGLKANGTIKVSSFVTVDPSTTAGVIQATAALMILGVSQVGPKNPAGLQLSLYPGTVDQTAAAYAGDNLEVFTGGDITSLTVGSAAVNPGDLLTNDGNGNGITAAPGSGKYVGALTAVAGNPGEIIKVLCLAPASKA